MMPVRTVIMGTVWMMLAWAVMLPAGIATAQENEQIFVPAHSINSYRSSIHFNEVMQRLDDGRLSPNFLTWGPEAGYTVMHSVAPAALELLQMAVARGGDCAVTSTAGVTPLHIAAMQFGLGPGPNSIHILVDCGADVNAQESRGRTPLHAVYERVGPRGEAITFANFASPGHGVSHAQADIALALLERGADPNIRDGEGGDTPFMLLIGSKSSIPDRLGQIRLLAKFGADPNTRNNKGDTPLFEALMRGQSVSNSDTTVDIIKILLAIGADPDLRNRIGDTPLIHAAKEPDDLTYDMEALLKGGADPCLTDRQGRLAYDHAGPDGQLLISRFGGSRDLLTGICARQLDELERAEAKLGLDRKKRRQLQSCLNSLGFDSGKPDGLFGPRTRAAIQAWQLSIGLKGIDAAGHFTQGSVDTLLESCRTVAPQPACSGQSGDGGCWMEVSNQPGCHVWNPSPRADETVEWSGDCLDGKVSGKGRLTWRFREDGVSKTSWSEQEYRAGKEVDGHVVTRFSGGAEWEGPKIGGRWQGVLARRDDYEWICYRDGETRDAENCGATDTGGARMEVAQRTRLHRGPGRQYSVSDTGSLEPGQVIETTWRVGDWVTGDALEGFVHVSNLSESAGPAVGERFSDCNGCPEMVVVPEGSFMMGSNDEQPVHRVTIPQPFAVGVYEVTFREWDACVSNGGCSHRSDDAGWGRGDRPVIHVSWADAQEYVEWLSRRTGERYRLLSEAEWEYVARAGTTTAYHFGSTISSSQANYDENVGKTVPVGSYPANNFGLHDVHGNVWEWVEDCWHGSYRGAPSDGSAWISGCDRDARVLRGGSWYHEPRLLRSAYRVRNGPGIRYFKFGFRVARTLAP